MEIIKYYIPRPTLRENKDYLEGLTKVGRGDTTMSKINIKPLGDRVLIEPLKEDTKTKSGIVIPETAEKERPEKGRVVAVGDGRRTDDGKVIASSVKKGQIVLFSKYGPSELKVDGKEYLIAKEEDILAILED